MSKKIAVAGIGYVGLSLATLLAQKYQVTAVDIAEEKVAKVNRRESPIVDEYIEKSVEISKNLDTKIFAENLLNCEKYCEEFYEKII